MEPRRRADDGPTVGKPRVRGIVHDSNHDGRPRRVEQSGDKLDRSFEAVNTYTRLPPSGDQFDDGALETTASKLAAARTLRRPGLRGEAHARPPSRRRCCSAKNAERPRAARLRPKQPRRRGASAGWRPRRTRGGPHGGATRAIRAPTTARRGRPRAWPAAPAGFWPQR